MTKETAELLLALLQQVKVGVLDASADIDWSRLLKAREELKEVIISSQDLK